MIRSSEDVRRVLRFCIVGVTVAAVYFSLFMGFRQIPLPRLISTVAAFACAITFQYFAQTLFTFRRSARSTRQVTRFLAMVGGGLVISSAITSLIGPALAFPDHISGLIVVFVLPIYNFVFLSLWVYRQA